MKTWNVYEENVNATDNEIAKDIKEFQSEIKKQSIEKCAYEKVIFRKNI